MRYRKLLRFPIVIIILISHGINPFGNLVDTLPRIKIALSDREKEYLINACLHPKSAEEMRKMFYK